jgi:hypothetical protein
LGGISFVRSGRLLERREVWPTGRGARCIRDAGSPGRIDLKRFLVKKDD